MPDNSKDTIYIDIDDEITTLIDKVKSSSGRVVALVLPKRASVLQSIVNMKLLKRTAESEKKHLVLITSEAGLLPLAGAVGMHVAKTLTSKPEIPLGPNAIGANNDLPIDINEDETIPDYAAVAGTAASVGALSEATKKGTYSPVADNVETLQLDDDEEVADLKGTELASTAAAAAVAKKDKRLKVPNFDRFRTTLVIGILLLIGLIVLGVFAFDVWPHATIAIQTNASSVNTNVILTLDPSAQTADLTSGNIPAKQATEQKTFTQTVNSTGQKNNGTAATGTITINGGDCTGLPPNDIPSGTAVAQNNLTYITQDDTTFVYQASGKKCYFQGVDNSTNSPNIPIIAQTPGANYNTNGTVSFQVAGNTSVTASGTANGGTDNIIQIVAQNDIATATDKINANDQTSVKQDLINQLKGEGLYPVDITFAKGSPNVTSNPNVGSQSSTVTVTETVSYTMYGAYQSDINQALNKNISSKTTTNQNIISNGLDESAFHEQGVSGTTIQVSLATLAIVGPNISDSQIKKEAAGKGPKAIISSIRQNPDVTNVTVRLSPFWVSSAPSNISKITVHIAKPSKSA